MSLISASRVTAQTFTVLHHFTATVPYYTNTAGAGEIFRNNGDGANPAGGVILSGNTLYGTAVAGGSFGFGAVFALNTNGANFSLLHSFSAIFGPSTTNPDGANPSAGLVSSGSVLYGMAQNGGGLGSGTLFAINTNGSGFTNRSFNPGSDVANHPTTGLLLSGNTLYGATSAARFKINTNFTGYTALEAGDSGIRSRLILSGNTLYGTGSGGGTGNGTVYAVNTDGTGFRFVHIFTAFPPGYATNSDGAVPRSGLILSGNILYGTTSAGGTKASGIIFAVYTDGTGFTNLYHFTGTGGNTPAAELILSGNTLYGTANGGGSAGKGIVFAINTDGTGFTNLHSFTGSDGASPLAPMFLSGNTLYGTAGAGGSSGNGTVFSLTVSSVSLPQLTIIGSGTNVILTWPTNAVGFTLQSTTNLVSPTIWSTVSPAPTIVNGQNTVTNAVSGTQKFYRLSQ